MRFDQMENPHSIAEAERQSWIAGDTEKASILAKLADEADELERLRAFYYKVREFYPIQHDQKKAELLEALQGIWGCIKDAGEVNE